MLMSLRAEATYEATYFLLGAEFIGYSRCGSMVRIVLHYTIRAPH